MTNGDSLVSTQIDFLDRIFSGAVSNVVTAGIILLIGFVIGKLVGRLVQRLLHEIELNNLLHNITGLKISLEKFVADFITYFVYFVTVITALNQIGLTTTVLYIISGGVIILVIISIVLGIKDFIPNAIAGIVLYRKGELKVGDSIKTRNIEGKITKIDLVETCVETKSGDTIYIPNSLLTKAELTKLKRSRAKK
jgi:small-conductance mechanosensitive channel